MYITCALIGQNLCLDQAIQTRKFKVTLYYTIEDYTALHNVMQHYKTLYKAIRYYTMLIIQDYTTLYKTIRHYTRLYNTIQ
jgi:hypothetical protein